MIKPIKMKKNRVGKLSPLSASTPKVRDLPPVLLPETDKLLDLEDPAIKELRRTLGDDPKTERLIKRIIKLRVKEPLASLPELIAYDWLSGKGIPFIYQGSADGGRMMRGGQVPDFVIPMAGMAICWRIQGEYWHSRPGAKEQDLVNKIALLGGTAAGLPVSAVVDCWEGQIYADYNRVFTLALAGVELGR
tara:strand:- start:3718 stop:4290 length:573 start_codon:yes stop_codon:yes gene_type:complete